MRRAMVGFQQDERGDWVALLECGHRQHVRHRPPWQERPWVLTEADRLARVGSPLECRLCDEAAGEAPGESGLEGGDPACWADRVCADCGALLEDDPSGHRAGCASAGHNGGGSPPS